MDEDTTQIHNEPQDVTEDVSEQVESTEPVENEVAENTETVAQETETVEEQPVEDEEDDSYNPFDLGYNTPNIELPKFDPSQLPIDADGNLDVNALAELINQNNSQVAAATQTALQQSSAYAKELEEKRREELLWQKATEKYPELKDKQYAQDVQAYRFGKFNMDITGGSENAKLITPAQAAAAFQKRFGTAKAEGFKQGTENVRVQESVYTEPTSGTAAAAASGSDDLISQMRSADRSEAEKASQEWIKKRLFGE